MVGVYLHKVAHRGQAIDKRSTRDRQAIDMQSTCDRRVIDKRSTCNRPIIIDKRFDKRLNHSTSDQGLNRPIIVDKRSTSDRQAIDKRSTCEIIMDHYPIAASRRQSIMASSGVGVRGERGGDAGRTESELRELLMQPLFWDLEELRRSVMFLCGEDFVRGIATVTAAAPPAVPPDNERRVRQRVQRPPPQQQQQQQQQRQLQLEGPNPRPTVATAVPSSAIQTSAACPPSIAAMALDAVPQQLFGVPTAAVAAATNNVAPVALDARVAHLRHFWQIVSTRERLIRRTGLFCRTLVALGLFRLQLDYELNGGGQGFSKWAVAVAARQQQQQQQHPAGGVLPTLAGADWSVKWVQKLVRFGRLVNAFPMVALVCMPSKQQPSFTRLVKQTGALEVALTQALRMVVAATKQPGSAAPGVSPAPHAHPHQEVSPELLGDAPPGTLLAQLVGGRATMDSTRELLVHKTGAKEAAPATACLSATAAVNPPPQGHPEPTRALATTVEDPSKPVTVTATAHPAATSASAMETEAAASDRDHPPRLQPARRPPKRSTQADPRCSLRLAPAGVLAAPKCTQREHPQRPAETQNKGKGTGKESTVRTAMTAAATTTTTTKQPTAAAAATTTTTTTVAKRRHALRAEDDGVEDEDDWEEEDNPALGHLRKALKGVPPRNGGIWVGGSLGDGDTGGDSAAPPEWLLRIGPSHVDHADAGLGLWLEGKIDAADVVVVEYTGRVTRTLTADVDQTKTHHFCPSLRCPYRKRLAPRPCKSCLFVDGSVGGGAAVYIQHSPDPTKINVKFDQTTFPVRVMSTRPIRNEELFADYGPHYWEDRGSPAAPVTAESLQADLRRAVEAGDALPRGAARKCQCGAPGEEPEQHIITMPLAPTLTSAEVVGIAASLHRAGHQAPLVLEWRSLQVCARPADRAPPPRCKHYYNIF